MRKLITTIILLLCLHYNLSAQIINVESKRIATDTTGFSGKIGMSLSASKFTQSYVAAELAGQVQWELDKSLFLLVGDFDIVNAGGESFNNSGYGHLRFNHKVTQYVSSEIFSQLQYNSVTKIKARIINGAGARILLSPYENAKIYWGIAVMHEYEELLEPNIITRDIRLSTYMTFRLAPVETISITNTTYIQPLAKDFNDFRLANNTKLNFGITKKLSFTTNLSFLYDSRPPIEIPTVNYQIKNGLHYRFD